MIGTHNTQNASSAGTTRVVRNTFAARNTPLILNRYLPVKEVGAGGFGQVFACKDMLMQRLVAIKKIELTELDAQRASWVREDMNRDAQVDALNAFETGSTTINLLDEGEKDSLASSLERRYLANVPGLDEARTAAALSDPSIVTIYDCQIAANVVYLVMEYVEGTTLTQLLEDFNDEITLDIVAAVFQSVSRALEVAHENGVLHFDIKPDNVLIDAQGNVKVTDFGLATLCDAQGEGTATAGTIGYMPLEQMRSEPLDARTDEWALASIAYEMLVGQNPFVAPTLDQALGLIDGAELTLPSRCWDDLPDEADDVLFKALDPQKEDRYETVAEFADDFIPLLGDAESGYEELAALVSGNDEFDADEEAGEEGAGGARAWRAGAAGRAGAGAERAGAAASQLLERSRAGFSEVKRSVLARIFAACASGFVAALGAWNITALSGIENPLFWAFVAGCAALGAVIPAGGALAGLIVLSAALLANAVYAPGILLLFAAGFWWFFVGRRGKAQANALLCFPLLSAFGLGPAAALLTGYVSRIPQALATAAFGGLLCMLFASFGSFDLMNWDIMQFWNFSDASAATAAVDATAATATAATDATAAVAAAATGASAPINANLIALVTNLGTWIILASWVLSALVMSVLTIPRKRVLAIVGALAGLSLIMIGIWLAYAFDPAAATMVPPTSLLVSAVLSGALMLFAAAALPLPQRN